MAIYFNAIHALRQLTRANDKGQKLGKITNSLNTIHTTWEVTDVTGTQYLIDAYGQDAIELYSETFTNKSN